MYLAVIIPAYEPNMVLVQLLETLNTLYIGNETSVEFVVVDDGSVSSASREVFDKLNDIPRMTILKHPQNLGKGAALKTAIRYADENGVDLIVTADADGQHTAQDIKNVGDHAIKHQNFTIGSRDFKGDIPARSHFGNLITSKLFKLVFKLEISDTQSGLRAIPSRLFSELLSVKQNRYEYEFQSLINISKIERIDQVSIETIYEPGNPSSHFRPLMDSTLIYMVFFRYIFFVPIIALLDIAAFFTLSKSMEPTTAFAITRSISVLIYFFIMRNLVFHSQRHLVSQSVKFLVLVIINIVLMSSLLFSLKGTYSVAPVVIYVASTIILFVFNFAAQRYVIFKN